MLVSPAGRTKVPSQLGEAGDAYSKVAELEADKEGLRATLDANEEQL